MDEQEGVFFFFVIHITNVKQGNRHCYLFMNMYKFAVLFLRKMTSQLVIWLLWLLLLKVLLES